MHEEKIVAFEIKKVLLSPKVINIQSNSVKI